MGRIGCIYCEKSGRDFVARTFALIAPVDPVLHWVSWSYKTIPNAPKHHTTHRNMSLGSNGVNWVRLLRKIRTGLRGANFCIKIAPVHPILHQVSWSYEMIPNAPKHYATHQNMSSGPMGLIGCVHCEKSRRNFVARTFALNSPVHPVLHRVSWSYETIPNAPKHYTTHQNMSLGSNGAD